MARVLFFEGLPHARHTSRGWRLRVEPRDLEVHGLVTDRMEEIRLAWPGRMLDVRARGTGVAHLDPDRFAQVASNLASNALTYGAPDQPITVTTSLHEDAVELHVHNLGRPISRSLLGQIFEPICAGTG